MPLEAASWIFDLVATNPPGTDPRAQGDDHIRMLKTVLKNTFPSAVANRPFYFPNTFQKSANYVSNTIDANSIFIFNTATGNKQFTLPVVGADQTGLRVGVMKLTADVNTVTVHSTGPVIQPQAVTDLALNRVMAVAWFVWDGTNWYFEFPRYIDNNDFLNNTLDGGKLIDGSVSNAKHASGIDGAKLSDATVTKAKFESVTASRLLGRSSTVNGVMQEIALGAGLGFNATTGNLENTSGTGLVQKISTVSLSGAVPSIDFAIPVGSSTRFMFQLDGVVPSSDNKQLQILIQTGGATWQATTYLSAGGGARGPTAMDFAAALTTAVGASLDAATTRAVSNASGTGVSGVVWVAPFGLARRKMFVVDVAYFQAGGAAAIINYRGGGCWNGANNELTGVRFQFEGGVSVAEGSITMYGFV